MGDTAGIAGWRWIFIIEGSVSSAIAVVAYFGLVNLPENATKRNLFGLPPFLNNEEAAVMFAHIERDRGDAQTEQVGYRGMLYHLRDWKVWEFASYVMLNNTVLYVFAFFLSINLSDGFGYSFSRANLPAFQPYAVALVVRFFHPMYRDIS